MISSCSGKLRHINNIEWGSPVAQIGKSRHRGPELHI